MSFQDACRCSEADLRRLLEFCLDRDPCGPRMRQTPPKDKQEVITQLVWIGVVQ